MARIYMLIKLNTFPILLVYVDVRGTGNLLGGSHPLQNKYETFEVYSTWDKICKVQMQLQVW